MNARNYPGNTVGRGGALVLALFVVLACGPARAADFPAEPGLADYLAWSTEHSPALQQARHLVGALEGEVSAAGSLPDLKLGYAEMLVPVETRVGPQQRAFTISQTIPWFGTLGLQEDVARSRATEAAARLDNQILSVHRDIRNAWYELALAQGEARILAAHLELARQAEVTARVAYEAGQETYPNLLKAQMELGTLEARLHTLEDRFQPLNTRLGTLAGKDRGGAAPLASLDPPAAADRIPRDRDALSLLMLQNNPGLRARQQAHASARSTYDLAARQGGPSFTLGVDYIMTGPAANPGVADSGKDPVIARLGVSLPLWGGRVAGQKSAAAEQVKAADRGLGQLGLELEGQLEEALFRWQAAERDLLLYRETLLPRAGQALQVADAAYQSGQMTFADLLSFQQNLLGIELASLQAEAGRCKALNELITILVGEAALRGGPGAPKED